MYTFLYHGIPNSSAILMIGIAALIWICEYALNMLSRACCAAALFGPCVDLVSTLFWTLSGPCLDLVWTLSGPCLDLVWTLFGPCLDLASLCGQIRFFFSGPCLDLVWTLFGPCLDLVWTLSGPCLDLVWTLLFGPCCNLPWSVFGPCLDLVRKLFGPCVDLVWYCTHKHITHMHCSFLYPMRIHIFILWQRFLS